MSETAPIAQPLEASIQRHETMNDGVRRDVRIGGIALSETVLQTRESILETSKAALDQEDVSLDAQISRGVRYSSRIMQTDSVPMAGANGLVQSKPVAELTSEQRRMLLPEVNTPEQTVVDLDSLSNEAKRLLVIQRLDTVLAKSMDPGIKQTASERNIAAVQANSSFWLGGDLVHATSAQFVSRILERGLLAGDLHGENARIDTTPLQADFNRIRNDAHTDTSSQRSSYMAERNGLLMRFVREPGVTDYKREGNGNMDTVEHATILVGLPSSEIGGITITDENLDRTVLIQTIVEHGMYIPIYDSSDTLIFSPEDFQQEKLKIQAAETNIISDMDVSPDTTVQRVVTSDRTVTQILRALTSVSGSTGAQNVLFPEGNKSGEFSFGRSYNGATGVVKIDQNWSQENGATKAQLTERSDTQSAKLHVSKTTETQTVDVELLGELRGVTPTEAMVRSMVARKLLELRRELNHTRIVQKEAQEVSATQFG